MRNKILSDLHRNYEENMTIREFCELRDEYTVGKIIYRFDSWTNAKVEAGVVDSNKCPNCDKYFDRLSSHWNRCGEPELTENQKELITGTVMSDGTVSEDGSVSIYSCNKEFLQWLDKELDFMSYGVLLNDTGEDRHKRNIKSGFDTDRNANYKDVYRLKCPVHSFTERMRDIYTDGEKILHNIKLTPKIIKMWYCCDGGLKWSEDKYAYSEIRAISQSEYDDEISDMFDGFNFNVNVSSGNIRLYSDSDKFLSVIGPSAKGMEYKWENKDRNRYNKLKP